MKKKENTAMKTEEWLNPEYFEITQPEFTDIAKIRHSLETKFSDETVYFILIF
jgi:hypothetical protein